MPFYNHYPEPLSSFFKKILSEYPQYFSELTTEVSDKIDPEIEQQFINCAFMLRNGGQIFDLIRNLRPSETELKEKFDLAKSNCS